MPRLIGQIRVPGDKSIGHRSFLLSALADGISTVTGVGDGADLASTRSALSQLGVTIEQTGPDTFKVHGVGLHGLKASAETLDCGNSGTTIRLLMGILAGQNGTFRLTGDESLQRRPMERVAKVVRPFGARFEFPKGDHPPVVVHGSELVGTTIDTQRSSAQVKSAALLAGLVGAGKTTVIERGPSRDHTERMLQHLGVELSRDGLSATLLAPSQLRATEWRLPGDPSSAAFWLAAAAILPGSELTVIDTSLNPTRTGFLDVLSAMGVDLRAEITGDWGGEPVGRIEVRGGNLIGARVEGELALRALDELPLVAVLGALADGETVVGDARELAVKESDRIQAMADGLSRMGAQIRAIEDGWSITGTNGLRGAQVLTYADHRIALALTVAGLRAQGAVELDDPACAAVSYRTFPSALRALLQEDA